MEVLVQIPYLPNRKLGSTWRPLSDCKRIDIGPIFAISIMSKTSRFLYPVVVLLIVLAAVCYWNLNSGRSESIDSEQGQSDVEGPPKVKDAVVRATDEKTGLDGIPEALVNFEDEQLAVESGNRMGLADEFQVLFVEDLERVELDSLDPTHSHKISEWIGRLNPSVIELADRANSGEALERLNISLPDGANVQVTDIELEEFSPGRGCFTGRIADSEYGEVVLSYVNEAVAASFRGTANGDIWEIRSAGNGQQYFTLVDAAAMGECGLCSTHGQTGIVK